MYEEIISKAVNVGYTGLNYYRYNRDDFYHASNLIALSDDYKKIKINYHKNENEEYYLGFKREKEKIDNITYDGQDKEKLHELLELIGIHKIFIDISNNQYSTILNDIQAIYYVIGHIYQKALAIISKSNPIYSVINTQPLTNCLIDEKMIDNLSIEEKKQLVSLIKELFTTHVELSNHFDETIDKMKKTCKFDDENIESISITEFMKNITILKKEIEDLMDEDILEYKNTIVSTKNILSALRYLQENDLQQYLQYCEYDEILRKKIKEVIKKAYIKFYKNKDKLRYNEIMSYFSDILSDPRNLTSTNDQSKSMCEEIYEEIIKELDNGKIPEIDNKEDFKIFTMRISAPNFCQFKLLYTYEKGNPLCRLEVYDEMIKRIYGEDLNGIIQKTIEQIAKNGKLSTYDCVVCSDKYIRNYIKSKEISDKNISTIIQLFNQIDCLEYLIDYIQYDSLEMLEEEIINQMNNEMINGSEVNSYILYKKLIKRKTTTF